MKRVNQILQNIKAAAKENRKSFPLYLTAFFIPLVMFFFVRLLFRTGAGSMLTGTLTFPLVLTNGAAGLCFLYYIRHTKGTACLSHLWQIALSAAYGLCSYGIIQENSVATLCLYAFFPLLFFALELMLFENRHCYFIVLCSLALMLDPECMLPIFFLLLLLSVFELGLQEKLTMGNFFHKAGCFLLAFFIAAFRIFPQLESAYSLFAYSGFDTTCSPLVFLSRFLPASTASIAYFNPNGMDIYFGLFFVLSFFLFFTVPDKSGKRKRYYALFTAILIASLWISPIRYVFNLFTSSDSLSLCYSFFLVFWCLKLSGEALSHLNNIHTVSLHIAAACTALLLLLSVLGSAHNFYSGFLPGIAALFLIYAVLLYLSHKKETIRRQIQSIICVLIIAELGMNVFSILNTDFIPANRNLISTYLWEASADDEKDESLLSLQEAYETFSEEHTNSRTNNVLKSLKSTLSLDSSEFKEYAGTEFPNDMEMLNALCHKAGIQQDLFTPYEADITLENTEYNTFISLGNGIFSSEPASSENNSPYTYAAFHIQAEKSLPANLYLYNNNTSELLQLTQDNSEDSITGQLILSNLIDGNINFQLTTYTLNEEVLDKLPDMLDAYATDHSDSQSFLPAIYAGMIVTCIGLLLFFSLYFNSDKEKVYRLLRMFQALLDNWKLPKRLRGHFFKNRIYYLAFLIPVLLFVGNMIVTDCTPFGNNSFFDEDGISLTLPSFLDIYYSLKDGNTYLSMNGGYGASIYANQPLVQLYSFFALLSPEQIAPFLLFLEAFCLGLCGFSMAFYMTHRLHGTKVSKTDYRLLVPSMIYTLNAYMVSMHNYTGWYYTLLAFPLLMLAMDYLIYKKKKLPYILLLAYCIITNLYLTLYICIFLVIYFFTCQFQNRKDFFRCGIRFACCSLAGAANSFFIIANTLLSSYDSPYKNNDSILPTFGLHTGFLEQWKRHMIFTTAPSVSGDNGMLNVYCGILTLLLVLLYFSAKSISLKNKFRKLIPILILYISFNGQVLSYLWNGLHYQTKVPNRYAFLALFLLAEISFEGIYLIKDISIKKYSISVIALAGFFLICQFLSEGNSSLSWIATLVLCCGYLLLHILFQKGRLSAYPRILVVLLVAELGCNMTYAVHHFGLNYITYYGNYASTADYINETLTKDNDYFRVSYPSPWLSNLGQIYHTGSNSLFNSFVSSHQGSLNGLYGFYCGGNLISTTHTATPLGMSLSSSRYIFLPIVTTGTIEGLEHYKYLGILDYYYVYENPDALSLGIYAPKEAANLDPADLTNQLTGLYTETAKDMFAYEEITYNVDDSVPNTFYCTDKDGNVLSYEEAEALYLELQSTATIGTLKEMRLHLNYIPCEDGVAYLYGGELTPLERSTAGTLVRKDMYFPNKITWFSDTFTYVILDDDILDEFLKKASESQLENVTFTKDTITGTTNYTEDGYTMLSLACDRNWHAYIDGTEVEIEDPYACFMMIKTPAGKHTLELKYVPYGMKLSKGITFGCWLLTAVIAITAHRIKRRKKPLPSE